jgi:hypothetical protein
MAKDLVAEGGLEELEEILELQFHLLLFLFVVLAGQLHALLRDVDELVFAGKVLDQPQQTPR